MSFKMNKKKAFTLTELLVVVVIIGILATVALPKFNKVLVTRRTTEAEEIMRAIRTEQERRCALDKPYATNLSALSDIVPNTNTDSYKYVAQAAGVNAQSKQLDYQLQMPSYTDGRICCEGAGCSQLNKDYPTCRDLRRMPDYQAPDSACAASLPGETGDPIQCSPTPPDPVTVPCDESEGLCGTQMQPFYCDVNTGEWNPGELQGECEHLPSPRTYPDRQRCDPPKTGWKTRQCTITHNHCNPPYDKECGEWDESGCTTSPEEWVWIIPYNIDSYTGYPFPYVMSQSDPNYCDWDGAWNHSEGSFLNPRWNCDNCNQMRGDLTCDSTTGTRTISFWYCRPPGFPNGGPSWERYCHIAKCVKLEDANQPGYRIVSDTNNPFDMDKPRPFHCDY